MFVKESKFYLIKYDFISDLKNQTLKLYRYFVKFIKQKKTN